MVQWRCRAAIVVADMAVKGDFGILMLDVTANVVRIGMT
jgi:hypothetical protein